MQQETKTRSLFKTISWRVWATLTTTILVFIFTSKLEIAITVGLFETLSKFFLYYFHERAWAYIPYGRQPIKPMVLWFTGLSGSGKTSLAQALFQELQKLGINVEHLDGDQIRQYLPQIGFDRKSRSHHISYMGYLASSLEKKNVLVIASFISPYAEDRQFVRQLCQNFVEIYLSTPLAICEQRDHKGLYAKARQGEILQFTGINDPYEVPENPELTFDTSQKDLNTITQEIVNYIRKKSSKINKLTKI